MVFGEIRVTRSVRARPRARRAPLLSSMHSQGTPHHPITVEARRVLLGPLTIPGLQEVRYNL
jgi:hypothetical protein